jgi:hypothetical protein
MAGSFGQTTSYRESLNMSKADKSNREYRPCNKTKLIDKLRRLQPEISLHGAKYNHGPLCASRRYFVPCDCNVSITLADGTTYS